MSSSGSKEKPLISVIIPTHNRAALLQEALASVYAQEGVGAHFDMEVIVVDDASSDTTPEVVRRYPGLRYIRLETNRGPQVARNLGIKASKGNYVSFLDDDDLWLPYKLAILLRVLETHPDVGVAYGQTIVRSGNLAFVKPHPQRAVSGRIFRESLLNVHGCVGTHMSLVRRQAFDKAGHFDEDLSTHHDYDMELRLAFHFPFMFIPVPVAIYRRSMQGNYVTNILQGHHESALRYVVEKGLAMLRDTAPDFAALREEALTRIQLRVAYELQQLGEMERMRAYLLKALRDSPWIARKPWARSSITQNVCRLALQSGSPIAVVRAFRSEVGSATRNCGLRDRLALWQLQADIWWKVAAGLRGGSSRRCYRAALYAVVRSLLYNPFKLGLIFPSFLIRGVIGAPRQGPVVEAWRRKAS